MKMKRGCSLCGRPRVAAFRAFCSATCRDQDLLAWGNEAYVMGEDPDLNIESVFSDEEGEKALDS